MKTSFITLLLALGLAATAPVAAQTPQLDWEWTANMGRPRSGSGFPDVAAGDVLAAAGGGAVLTGGYEGYLILGAGRGDTLRTNGLSDGILVKYNALGQKQWAVSVGGRGYCSLGTVVQDNQQRYGFVVRNSTTIANPGGGFLRRGLELMRYSATGAFVGASRLANLGVQVEFMALDAAQNLALSGNAPAGDTLATVRLTADCLFVAKLTPAGVPRWVRQLTSSAGGSGRIYGQAVLPNGDVLVGGQMFNNLTLDPAHQFVGNLGFLARYNGTTGAVVWARTVSVPVQPLADAVTGQAYVAGLFSGSLNLDGIAAATPTANANLFVARLDAATGRGQSLVFAGGGPSEQQQLEVRYRPGAGFLLGAYSLGRVDFGFDFSAAPVPPAPAVGYLLQLSAAGVPVGFYPLPYGAPRFASFAPDALGRPYLVAEAQLPVQFGQLPYVVPRGIREIVLAHVGLVVLGTRTATATAVGLAAYPNPATAAGPLTLACAAWPTATVRLLDAVGRTVWAGALVQGRATLPPLGLPPGCYVVQARNGGRTATVRLLLE